MPSSGSTTQTRPDAARDVAALLAQHAVVRPGGGDAVEQQPLGGAVGVRHHVGGAALRLHPARRPAEPLEQQRAGVAGGAKRELEQAVGGHGASVLKLAAGRPRARNPRKYWTSPEL